MAKGKVLLWTGGKEQPEASGRESSGLNMASRLHLAMREVREKWGEQEMKTKRGARERETEHETKTGRS